MTKALRSEAVVLYSKPFGDSDQILEVYSKEYGKLKLFSKRGRSPKKDPICLQPLSHVEVHFHLKETSELGKIQEIQLVYPFLPLKASYEKLEIGCRFLKILRQSQPLEKPSPGLFTLLVRLLKHLETTKDPSTLFPFFSLKLALHDGLLALSDECSFCNAPLKTVFLHRGESSCASHAPPSAVSLTQEEKEHLFAYLQARSLDWVEKHPLPSDLREKIEEITGSIYSTS